MGERRVTYDRVVREALSKEEMFQWRPEGQGRAHHAKVSMGEYSRQGNREPEDAKAKERERTSHGFCVPGTRRSPLLMQENVWSSEPLGWDEIEVLARTRS